MTGMLRRSLLLALVVVLLVGVVGCSLFNKGEKEMMTGVAPKERAWGDATTENIMKGVTVDEEPVEEADK